MGDMVPGLMGLPDVGAFQCSVSGHRLRAHGGHIRIVFEDPDATKPTVANAHFPRLFGQSYKLYHWHHL